MTGSTATPGTPAAGTAPVATVLVDELGPDVEHEGGPAPPGGPLAARQRVAYVVPVLSMGRELVLRLLALGWCTTSVMFWLWWASPQRGGWNFGRGVATAGLAWLFLLGAHYLFFVCRMSRPNPALPLPQLRVAIVVTKAPSEPWTMVEATLRAMLAQDLPYPFDVWLADEHPSGKAVRWCRGHGVKISTRYGVAEYHQPSWPRRTRCKEGNLAYFYDRYGYDGYDVVAQLDADHVPAPGYLTEMVRPFLDPTVGYVAAPSLCDANADRSWTVRGRLYCEATLHGPVQAGCNDGYAPVAIGSHYAVRTAALRSVGGIGPELAEDYTTTLWMQSGGWNGVFAIDAEAHGDGPETLSAMLLQERQWAESLGTILTRWAPSRMRTVPLRARIRLTFALVYYLVQGLACLSASLLPAVGVTIGATWGNSGLAEFYLYLWPSSLLLMLTTLWLRRCGVLRPRRARLWSYDVMLFQLVRWPWTTWGFLRGMCAGRREVSGGFKVTPKGRRQGRLFDDGLLLPLFALVAFPLTVLLLAPRPERALGLFLVLMGQSTLYMVAALSVVALHLQTARRHRQDMLAARDARRRGRHRHTPSHRQDPWLTADAGGRALALATTCVLLGSAALVAAALRLL